MLKDAAPRSLSYILAIRMIAASVTVSFLLMFLFVGHYLSNTASLRDATLRANVDAIAQALNRGENPAALPLYRDYPAAYGFRVFDRRNLAKRRILASANTRWLPPVQRPASTMSDPDGDRDGAAVAGDLLEGFTRLQPNGRALPGDHVVSLLIHREVVGGHKYWVQAYMIGDPAWAGTTVILAKLTSHVLIPVLFIIPALTLAIFLAVRAALQPLRLLSQEASKIGTAVARGQMLVPVSEQGMAREFSEVAATINTILARLDRSLQLQKQFTSDAAHELRTPLAVLQLEISQLPPSPARERIKSDLSELGNLVNELLRFAQAEDVMVHEREAVDVAAVARAVCEDAVVAAIARRQAIELDHEAAGCVVPGNATLIEIAVRNLVDNALKYSPPGSVVSVRVDSGPVVVVEDCGPGIPAGQRGAIFERFWRADRQAGNGAGIGLALVRRIAQLHDGCARIEDRPSGGTRLILDLTPGQDLPCLSQKILSA
jgi:signal transduction histidine kinase